MGKLELQDSRLKAEKTRCRLVLSLNYADSRDSIEQILLDDETLNIACTNARSVVEKVDSLVTLFEEMKLSFALLTETWLTNKVCSRRKLEDLTTGAEISFIRRDRGSRGGGVAIAYNPNKIKLTKLQVPQNSVNAEIVCAVGNSQKTKRKIAMISIYMPPSLRRDQLDGYLYTLVELLDIGKTKYEEPIIFMGGDFNGKDLGRLFTAFPELNAIGAGATRNGLALDEVYTNVTNSVVHKDVQEPLSKRDGTKSDHAVIVAAVKLPKQKKARTISFSFRPITSSGKDMFKELIEAYDWNQIKRNDSSGTAQAFDCILSEFFEQSFPVKTRKFKSTDAPWFNQEARRAVKRKIRIYRLEGKSERYKRAQIDCDRIIGEAKKRFWNRVLEKTAVTRNSSEYYRAVHIFKTKEAHKPWNISCLYPDHTENEIAELVSEFFKRISQEYEPIPDPSVLIETEPVQYLQQYEVSGRLKSFRKPKSQVPGDIHPDLVTAFHAQLAVPLTYIFNQTLTSHQRPELWKLETVTIIPQNSSPSS